MAHIGGGFEAPPLTQNHHFSPQNGPPGFIYPGMGQHGIGWEDGVVAGDWLEGKLGGSRGLAGSRARWQQGIGQEHSWQSAIGRGLSPMGDPGRMRPLGCRSGAGGSQREGGTGGGLRPQSRTRPL